MMVYKLNWQKSILHLSDLATAYYQPAFDLFTQQKYCYRVGLIHG